MHGDVYEGEFVNGVVKVSTNLPTEKSIQVIGSITIVMGRETNPGETEENIEEDGK